MNNGKCIKIKKVSSLRAGGCRSFYIFSHESHIYVILILLLIHVALVELVDAVVVVNPVQVLDIWGGQQASTFFEGTLHYLINIIKLLFLVVIP